MPRPLEFDPDVALQRAMEVFLQQGYEATSINHLVDATGVNRFGLYGVFTSKRDLFIAALRYYADTFVTNAVAGLAREDADINDVRNYFTGLIDAAAAQGLPGPGCLMANSMTEIAPHDDEVRVIVSKHFERLCRLFASALGNARKKKQMSGTLDNDVQARALVIAAQGLWAYSRICKSKKLLSQQVDAMLAPLLQQRPASPEGNERKK